MWAVGRNGKVGTSDQPEKEERTKSRVRVSELHRMYLCPTCGTAAILEGRAAVATVTMVIF